MDRRPLHIDTLDAAMNERAGTYRRARAEMVRLRHEHADVLKEVRDAEELVRTAGDDLKELDDAIRRLDYRPLDDQGEQVGPGGRAAFEAIRANRIENGSTDE